MKKPFKLLIAVPCMDYVHADFMKSLLNLCKEYEVVNRNVSLRSKIGSLMHRADICTACCSRCRSLGTVNV